MLPNVLGTTTRADRPELVAEVRDMIATQPPDGVAWAQRAMADRPDSTSLLREFRGPALVVVGEEDTVTPPEGAADLLPGTDPVRLPAAGHLAPMENPEAFAEVVVPWINRVG
ncbi:hypothetical protein GCM10010470_10010 [Saccharopolyspora taberi]|uniref:AB hydrolase-1 domain-containing protein n=1 Tax=Saccharopolyspora taberi TaxID=60895 RepID=A0ABN3V580_9PSEU